MQYVREDMLCRTPMQHVGCPSWAMMYPYPPEAVWSHWAPEAQHTGHKTVPAIGLSGQPQQMLVQRPPYPCQPFEALHTNAHFPQMVMLGTPSACQPDSFDEEDWNPLKSRRADPAKTEL